MRISLFLWSAAAGIAMVFAAQMQAADTPDWIRLQPMPRPSVRSYPAMTYDNLSQQIVLFGGFDGESYLSDTWIFDGTSWTPPLLGGRRA